MKLTEKTIATLKPPPGAAQGYFWDDEVTGFGVVVGKLGRTFVVRGRVAGKGERVKVTIGRAGVPREDGHPWTVVLARQRARELIGQMASGINPNAVHAPAGKPTASGPTLRDAIEEHEARQRKRGRSERTISTFVHESTKYLAPYLDRPIAELTGKLLAEIHEQIKSDARDKGNRNQANEKGAPLANRIVAHVSAAWNSLNRKLEGALGSWNPARAVEKNVLKPKRERIDEDEMPRWLADVQTMKNPIQRDGLLFALYTGLRSEDVRTVRWEHVDFDARTLRLPDPKGGEGAAFTIPLSAHPMEILERRKAENASAPLVKAAGGNDHGWAFPGVTNDGDVIAISDLREQRHGDTHSRFPAEDVHSLRRTWESVAHEEGISELDVHVLSNHSFASHNVNATYIAQHLDHLARCAATIDAGIARRLAPPPTTTKKKRTHLRAVA